MCTRWGYSLKHQQSYINNKSTIHFLFVFLLNLLKRQWQKFTNGQIKKKTNTINIYLKNLSLSSKYLITSEGWCQFSASHHLRLFFEVYLLKVSNYFLGYSTEYFSQPCSPHSSVRAGQGFEGSRFQPCVRRHARCVSGGWPCGGRRPGPAAGWGRWWGPSGWPVSGRWRSRSQGKIYQRWRWTLESDEGTETFCKSGKDATQNVTVNNSSLSNLTFCVCVFCFVFCQVCECINVSGFECIPAFRFLCTWGIQLYRVRVGGLRGAGRDR